LAPIKPDDQSRTNTAGAAKTAASSIERGISLGPAAEWYGAFPSGRRRSGRGHQPGGRYAARAGVRQFPQDVLSTGANSALALSRTNLRQSALASREIDRFLFDAHLRNVDHEDRRRNCDNQQPKRILKKLADCLYND
jgi:hypothetical protein